MRNDIQISNMSIKIKKILKRFNVQINKKINTMVK